MKSNIDICINEKLLLHIGSLWSKPVIKTLGLKSTATPNTKDIVKTVYVRLKYDRVDKEALFIKKKIQLAPIGSETRSKAAAQLIIITLLILFRNPQLV